jgi:sugar O-acyltransferase (sialic acid O-acetyltransferase NeuD family)
MMRDLIILGLGAHGPEMAEIVDRVNAVERRWNLLGFISPDGRKVGERVNGYPVLGRMDVLEDHPDACVVPHGEVPERLEVPRHRLVSLIDPTAFVSRTAQVGVGCVLFPHCYVGLDARLHDFVMCLAGCVINHDNVIEERVFLASGVILAGYVHVEPDCFLGQGCNCKQYLTIGRGSLIGMGAVVTRRVEPNSVMVGNPARKLRDRH